MAVNGRSTWEWTLRHPVMDRGGAQEPYPSLRVYAQLLAGDRRLGMKGIYFRWVAWLLIFT